MKRTLAICALAVFASVVVTVGQSNSGSMNGKAGDMPAYYDDQLFTMNFMEVKGDLSHNKSVNEIYESDALVNGQAFVPVLDAIQGDGFNPLWREVEITFASGVTPVQYTSEEAIDAAVAAGQITLTETDEVYRCSVVGKEK